MEQRNWPENLILKIRFKRLLLALAVVFYLIYFLYTSFDYNVMSVVAVFVRRPLVLLFLAKGPLQIVCVADGTQVSE